MRVERVTEADQMLADAMARLVPQLSPHRKPPGIAELVELVAAPEANLIVARDGADVLGMLTLIVYRVPTGLRAWIHDVVVDEAARGRGVGKALTAEALRLAKEAGAISVELTTCQEREAANRLYRRLGFEQRETNVYVWRP
ncbi:MAG TPA: GNAT family N-acetyltransferase [Gaiellaceae bacterium]|jgi:ribosomal protein S18 acetylase RimI-like enzyme|nr:GNAT family N-acetyltransferase [Gaiellaceae bacterium]